MSIPHPIVDSHCHLDFDNLYDELPEIIQKAKDANIIHMVTISTRVKKFDRIKEIVETYDAISCSIGTHPHNACDEQDITVEDLIAHATHPKVVAIGEVGLDYHYHHSTPLEQAYSFKTHIEAARETGLPLIIHSRSAEEDTIKILEDETKKGAFKFILHCFSSKQELASCGIALGGMVSFSGIITFKKSTELREIAAMVPLENLLVETDAPYLAPMPFRGKRNEPAYVAYTLEELAKTKGLSNDEMADITTANFKRTFGKCKL